MWSAPSFLVPKKGKQGWRFITDLKGLNSVTKPVAQLIPSVEQCINSIGMANPIYFSVFDIHSAFYHIPIKPEHRHYTAFKTPTNCCEFVTMSQGLKNAPATLARVMQAIFKGILFKYMPNFFDDILIYFPNFDSHIAHMREIFTRIR